MPTRTVTYVQDGHSYIGRYRVSGSAHEHITVTLDGSAISVGTRGLETYGLAKVLLAELVRERHAHKARQRSRPGSREASKGGDAVPA